MSLRTPPGESPLGIVQEKLERGPLHGWRLLVACACLDRVRGTRAGPVVDAVLRRWPTPTDLGGSSGELEEILRPLGLGSERAKALRALSAAWEDGEWATPGDLPGVGAYALCAWGIFVDRILPEEEPADGWLAAYWRWAVAAATPKVGRKGGPKHAKRLDGRMRGNLRDIPWDATVGDVIMTLGQASAVLGVAFGTLREEARIGNLAARMTGRGRGWITTMAACRAWAEGKNAGNPVIPKRDMPNRYHRLKTGRLVQASAMPHDERDVTHVDEP